ncbi:hypothetical protein MMC30_005836 [Trapelia coarctata]|nr:hypothetical protein [Trapelia coarctata]
MKEDRAVKRQYLSTSHTYVPWSDQQHDILVEPSEPMATGGASSNLKLQVEDKVKKNVSRRIYMLGLGKVGKFVAHSLAGIPNRPPITLLFHNQSLFRIWDRHGRAMELQQHGTSEKREGFDVSLAESAEHEAQLGREEGETIYNLIVSVKGHATVAALSTITHRLTSESTILFLQNGMGIIQEVNEKVFPDADTRPSYMVGLSSYRLHSEGQFAISKHGVGTMALGSLSGSPPLSADPSDSMQRSGNKVTPSTRYLLRTITRTPVLAAMGLAPIDLFQLQLERLVVHSIIDPLTVMFDCKNGELLDNRAITRVMRLLLLESSLVIRSLPELQNLPNLNLRFSPAKLEYQVVSIARTTASNESSMVRDMKEGRETEIEYLSGYIVRRGEELGIQCAMNYMLMQMVKGKDRLGMKREAGLVPL